MSAADRATRAATTHTPEHYRALFEPRGVVVAGASTHPGKFGFVSLHNILACGYPGKVFATNREGSSVLGIECLTTIDDLPEDEVDLMFVCTPKAANNQLLTAAAKKGIRAVFMATGGYGEAGEQGRQEERDLVTLCHELGLLLIGPNGQGVVSTPASLCAQIVAPYPPAGGIGVASQSGNFVSSFLNLSCATGVGISRAVSAGNAAATSIADLLEFFATDPATTVALAYMEGIDDGRGVARALGQRCSRDAHGRAQGRCHRRRCGRCCKPHRIARDRRPDLRRDVRPDGRNPRGHGRRSFRGRRDLRHPASSGGQSRRCDDDGRWMGGGHCRRDHPTPRSGAGAAPRGSPGRHRRVAPAQVESEQPGRPRRGRDP